MMGKMLEKHMTLEPLMDERTQSIWRQLTVLVLKNNANHPLR